MKKHQLFSLIFFTIPLSLSDKIDLSQGNGLVNAKVDCTYQIKFSM